MILILFLLAVTVVLGKQYRPFSSVTPSTHARFPTAKVKDPTRLADLKLPSARLLSTVMQDTFKPDAPFNPRGLTDAHTAWGFLVSHDMSRTSDAGAEYPIAVPKCDAYLDADCSSPRRLPFLRSMVDPTRLEPFNFVTPQLDASTVYGSNGLLAHALRTMKGGKLLSTDNDLPFNLQRPFPNASIGGAASGGACTESAWNAGKCGAMFNPTPARTPTHKLRMAGDARANLFPNILVLHTILLREHNRLCAELSEKNTTWDDETLYQESRRLVIAVVQHITYREYYGALIGALPLYAGYEGNVSGQPDMAFVSAMKYLHAEVSPMIRRRDATGHEILQGDMLLEDAYYNPQDALVAGIEPILRGMLATDIRAVRAQTAMRDRPLDQFAYDIQRGRDHGVPGYIALCKAYSLSCGYREYFRDVVDDKTPRGIALADALNASYGGNISALDAFVGFLIETPRTTPSRSLGSLATAIISAQFVRSRSADPFWYENNQFTPTELAWITTTTFLQLVTRNVPNVTHNILNGFFIAPPRPKSEDSEASASVLSKQYKKSIVMSDYFQFFWTWDQGPTLRGAMLAKTTGHVAIGFIRNNVDPLNPAAALNGSTMMANVDMVIAARAGDETTPYEVRDYYSFDLGTPSKDTDIGCENDITFYEVIQAANGFLIVHFTKTMDTPDSKLWRGKLPARGRDVVKERQVAQCDAAILRDTPVLIVYAVSTWNPRLSYHGPTRGAAVVDLDTSDVGTVTGEKMINTDFWPIVVGVVVGVLLLIAGPVLWKFTENHRRVAKLLDNDKVATEVAESVALLNFEKVEYLNEIKSPTRIQTAFMKIVATLKMLSSFLPDMDPPVQVEDDEESEAAAPIVLSIINSQDSEPSTPDSSKGSMDSPEFENLQNLGQSNGGSPPPQSPLQIPNGGSVPVVFGLTRTQSAGDRAFGRNVQVPFTAQVMVVLTFRMVSPTGGSSSSGGFASDISVSSRQKFISAVVKCVKGTHGRVHSYRGGIAVATWTRTPIISRPCVNAIRVAVTVTQSLPHVHAGIDLSLCTVGSVGTPGLLMFNELCGAAVEGSAMLSLLCRPVGGSILVSKSVHSACTSAGVMRYVGNAVYTDAYRFPCSLEASTTPPEIFEVLDLRASEKDHGQASADEWMYLIQAEELAAESMFDFERGVQKFVRGEFIEAMELFQRYLIVSPDDVVALRYVEMCTEKME